MRGGESHSRAGTLEQPYYVCTTGSQPMGRHQKVRSGGGHSKDINIEKCCGKWVAKWV